MDPVKNLTIVTVSGGYAAGATSIALTTGHGARLPDPGVDGAFNLVWYDSTNYELPSNDPNVEIVRVTARATDTLTVTRAQESTSATAKNTAGATYSMILAFTKKSYDEVKAHVEASTGVHGITGAVVGTTDTQTLSAKTLTSPVINGSLSGTAIVDEDDMVSNSATKVPTQQSVKAYVDAAAFSLTPTGSDPEVVSGTAGTNGNLSMWNADGDLVDAGIAAAVTVTLTGTQALSNKTLTAPVLNGAITGTGVLDEDNMASNSATALATQQSIKAYVDGAVSGFITAAGVATLTNKTIDVSNNTIQGFPVEIAIAVSDETTDLTTGAGKVTFRAPWAFTLTAVRASVNTAPVDATLNVDINENGVSVLSTVITIDSGEKTSTTAATPAVISDSAIADDAELTIDIDQVGSTTAGKGLKVVLYGTRTI